MKNYIITTLMFLCIAVLAQNSHGQIFKKLEKKIERKINQRIEKKTDKSIEKVLDKVEKSIEGAAKNQTDESSSKDNPNENNPGVYVSSKFDFIPGDKVLFFDDFINEAKGDFPARWNTNSSGEIVTIHNINGKWLKIPDNTVSFPELKTVLPDNFTIEFDLFYPKEITRPPVTFGFTEVNNPAKSSIQHKKLFYFHIPATIKDNVGYSTSLYSGREITQSWPANKKAAKVIHVSIAVNTDRIRLYLDERKIFDLPKAFEPDILRNNFHFRSAPLIPKPQDGFYISNLRIAESGLDAQSQLLNNGKYITTGIYFETGSADIKPQSYGTLKELADLLIKTQDMKVKIVGHTDSDGSTDLNMALSRKRAEAVKSHLENEFGITANRLTFDGKGASEPISNNNSPEGKATNRRVEFIKM